MARLANLSIDWLKEAEPARQGSRLGAAPAYPQPDRHLEDALLAYGGRLLRGLQGEPSERARLHDLLRKLRLPLQDTISVIDYLADREYVKIEDKDPVLGNHLVRLTEAGEQIAGRS